MPYYNDLNAGGRKEITDDNYTDDEAAEEAWRTTVANTTDLPAAVNRHISDGGQLPSSIRDQVEANPFLSDPERLGEADHKR